MRALDLLKGASERCVKFKYSGKIYSGLRVSARRKKEPTKLEASRWGGAVADIQCEIVEISTDTDVEPIGECN